MEGLTEKVLAFQRSQTGESLGALVEELSPRVYKYPRFKLGWDEDACGEFYVYFYPRLVRLLSRFRDQGKPFESYLCSVMSWQLRNFAREKRRTERGWRVSVRLGRPDDEEPHASAVDAAREAEDQETSQLLQEIASSIQTPADRRNLLILGLKCVRSLTAGGMAVLSHLTAVPMPDLARHAASLSMRLEPREKRLEAFRQRRNRAFSRAQTLEAELFEEIDMEKREALLDRLSMTRTRMKSAITRMSRIMLNPTNREIAEVLGIPKGTVDSGLYWLKRKLSVVYYPGSRQSA